MLSAADSMTSAEQASSPGPGWQDLLPDATQRVWRRETPSGVELRIDPPPLTAGRLAAQILTHSVGGGAGIGLAGFWMGKDPFWIAAFWLAWCVGAVFGVVVIGGLVRAARAKRSSGRVQLSEFLIRIDIPTAPMWRNSFSAMPRDICVVEVRPMPWHRGIKPFERLFGINQREVYIERVNGVRFIVSPMEPAAAELLAAQLLAQMA